MLCVESLLEDFMSTKKGEANQKGNQDNGASAAAGASNCRCNGCKSKVTKFGFCQEHFEMYMSGVIRGDGTKPVDFEKKLELFLANRKSA
jgi:hypothetical protein